MKVVNASELLSMDPDALHDWVIDATMFSGTDLLCSTDAAKQLIPRIAATGQGRAIYEGGSLIVGRKVLAEEES